jgi:hypothetical protein
VQQKRAPSLDTSNRTQAEWQWQMSSFKLKIPFLYSGLQFLCAPLVGSNISLSDHSPGAGEAGHPPGRGDPCLGQSNTLFPNSAEFKNSVNIMKEHFSTP